MAQNGPVSCSVEVASGGKWRRNADQIRSSNIPIQQDTDVQFNKPTVKPAILPPDAEPLATPTSCSHSVVQLLPLELRYPVRTMCMW